VPFHGGVRCIMLQVDSRGREALRKADLGREQAWLAPAPCSAGTLARCQPAEQRRQVSSVARRVAPWPLASTSDSRPS